MGGGDLPQFALLEALSNKLSPSPCACNPGGAGFPLPIPAGLTEVGYLQLWCHLGGACAHACNLSAG